LFVCLFVCLFFVRFFVRCAYQECVLTGPVPPNPINLRSSHFSGDILSPVLSISFPINSIYILLNL
jgi:hypothetical protein